MNNMRTIRVQKVTLNIGTGKDQVALEKAERLLAMISGKKPVRTVTQERIAAWGLRPGLPIGCKVTLRNNDAMQIIPRLLTAKDHKLADNNFDNYGNVSFGMKEYIDIKDAKYAPEIGSMGLQCSITLVRPGFRIKSRKYLQRTIPKNHRITQADAIAFMKEHFKITLLSDIEE